MDRDGRRSGLPANLAAGGEQLVGLESGETIVMQGGPLDGYKAIFDVHVAGDERVRVLLKLLQVQQMKLELPIGQVLRITRP